MIVNCLMIFSKNIDCPKKLIVSSGVKKLIDYENEILEIYKNVLLKTM